MPMPVAIAALDQHQTNLTSTGRFSAAC